MTRIEATEARKAFSKTLRDASHGERVVIMKRGKPAAAIVREAKAEAEIAEQGTIPWEQIKAELGL